MEEFTRLYVTETNRLRAEHRRELVAAPRELEANKRRALEILNWMREGDVNGEWKAELARLDQQRAGLETTIASTASQPPAPVFHPNMARVFEQKIRGLANALEHEDLEQRELARSSLRDLIKRIVVSPGDELLRVEGNLGEILAAADAPRERLSVKLVAGAGFEPASTTWPGAFVASLRPTGLLAESRAVFSDRPEGTYPTGADWGFVTHSKQHRELRRLLELDRASAASERGTRVLVSVAGRCRRS